MRRDVRLLGSLLGGVLSDVGGQELLDDVERLRHAVIESRRAEAAGREPPEPAAGGSPDGIAALVASWPLDRAEQVASAFTVYFHLANLAEEHQRIRALRERDVPGHPLPESLEATVRQIRREQGGDRLAELLAGLRVHPVFTAHPTEARRAGRGRVAAPDLGADGRAGRSAPGRDRPHGDPPRAARADRCAVANLTTSGQRHGPDR